METPDQFIGRVSEVGGALVVFIPKRNVEFSGLKKGDLLKVWYKQQNANQ